MVLEEKKTGSRTEQKHEAIVSGALEVFLDKGFVGASVDDVAARSGVSKQTVYKHFGDKERLFIEVVSSTIDRFGEPFFRVSINLKSSSELEQTLRDLAQTLLESVLEPQILRLRRLVISEVMRFPDLGKHYFDKGPRRGVETLAEIFKDFSDRGLLKKCDSEHAATQFTWLVISIPVNRVMLLGESAMPSSNELKVIVDNAVEIFLAEFSMY